MPVLAISFLIMGLACTGFPGTLGFVGQEFLVDGAVDAFPIMGFAVVIASALTGLAVLRMYADASGNRRVGVHPSSHHVLHEDDAHAVLHGLREVILCPWTRPVLASDVRDAKDPRAAADRAATGRTRA